MKDPRIPLWGYKKTKKGYIDTSIERHPYIVLVLVVIVFIVGVLPMFFLPEASITDPKNTFFLLVLVYFLLKMSYKVFTRNNK